MGTLDILRQKVYGRTWSEQKKNVEAEAWETPRGKGASAAGGKDGIAREQFAAKRLQELGVDRIQEVETHSGGRLSFNPLGRDEQYDRIVPGVKYDAGRRSFLKKALGFGAAGGAILVAANSRGIWDLITRNAKAAPGGAISGPTLTSSGDIDAKRIGGRRFASEFGAAGQNGVAVPFTDTSIQGAHDDLPSTGGAVEMAALLFVLANTVAWTKPADLRGQGYGSHVKAGNALNKDMFTVNVLGRYEETFADFLLDGNASQQGLAGKYGINAGVNNPPQGDNKDVRIIGMTFDNTKDYAISGQIDVLRVQDTVFNGQGTGLGGCAGGIKSGSGGDWYIDDSDIGASSGLHCIQAISLNRCHINACNLFSGFDGALLQDCLDIALVDVSFVNNQAYGCRIMSGQNGVGVKRIIIADCRFESNNVSNAGYDGLRIDNGGSPYTMPQNIRVHDCHCWNNPASGLNQRYGISLNGLIGHARIHDNDLIGNATGPLLYDTLFIPSDFEIRNNPGYNPAGKYAQGWDQGNGSIWPGAPNIVGLASTDYLVEVCDILLTSTGGTGVSIAYGPDTGANAVQSGLATCTAVLVRRGWKVNLGAYSVAPTVKAWGA